MPFGEFVSGIAITPQHVVLASAETGLWHLNLTSGAIISHAPSRLYSVLQPVVAPDGTIFGSHIWGRAEHWDAAGLKMLGAFGRPAADVLPDGSLPPVTPDLMDDSSDPGQVSVAPDGSVWIPAPGARRIVHVDFSKGALDICERTGYMTDAQARRIGAPLATAIAKDGTVWVATRSDLMHLGPVTAPSQLCDPDPPAITNVKPDIRYTNSRGNTVRIRRADVAATISGQATVTVTLDRLRTGGRRPLRVASFPPTLLYLRPTPYPLAHLAGRRVPTGRYRITVRARNDSGNRTTATKTIRLGQGARSAVRTSHPR